MNKKFISAILAGALSISAMSISAFATAFTPSSGDTADLEKAGAKTYAIQAGFQAPAINVTIPSAVKAVLNPYKVKVELEDGVTSEDGITSPVYAIENHTTDFGIKVSATAWATGTADITVVPGGSTSVPAETSAKQVYAEVKASVKTATAPVSLDAPLVFQTSQDAAKAKNLLTLKAATDAKNPEVGYFQIGGSVSKVTWATTDKVTLNLILDLQPANATDASATVVGDGKNADGSDA